MILQLVAVQVLAGKNGLWPTRFLWVELVGAIELTLPLQRYPLAE